MDSIQCALIFIFIFAIATITKQIASTKFVLSHRPHSKHLCQLIWAAVNIDICCVCLCSLLTLVRGIFPIFILLSFHHTFSLSCHSDWMQLVAIHFVLFNWICWSHVSFSISVERNISHKKYYQNFWSAIYYIIHIFFILVCRHFQRKTLKYDILMNAIDENKWFTIELYNRVQNQRNHLNCVIKWALWEETFL